MLQCSQNVCEHSSLNNLLLLGLLGISTNHRIILFLSPLGRVDGLDRRLRWQRACRTARQRMGRGSCVTDGVGRRGVTLKTTLFILSSPVLLPFFSSPLVLLLLSTQPLQKVDKGIRLQGFCREVRCGERWRSHGGCGSDCYCNRRNRIFLWLPYIAKYGTLCVLWGTCDH